MPFLELGYIGSIRIRVFLIVGFLLPQGVRYDTL